MRPLVMLRDAVVVLAIAYVFTIAVLACST